MEIAKTRKLIEIQRRMNQFLKRRCKGLPEYYEPRNWLPHVTLAMDDLTGRNFENAWAELKDSTVRFRQKLHNLCIVKQYPSGKIRIDRRYEL